MFRHIAFLLAASLATVAGCAASTEPTFAEDTQNIGFAPSAESVLADIERIGTFVETENGYVTLRFTEDRHLSSEMRHGYEYTEKVVDAAGAETVKRDQGTVRITWIATPSWSHPLRGHWVVDLYSSTSHASAPGHRYEVKTSYDPQQGAHATALVDRDVTLIQHDLYHPS